MVHDKFDYAFVHGDAVGSWVWDETIAALDRQTNGAFGRALALDAPGCGSKRSSATNELTFEEVATAFIDDIKRADMENVVLVGHSLGGQALALMAEFRPALFRRLVYVSCLIPLPGQNVAQMMGTGLHGSTPDEVGFPLDPTTSDLHDRLAAMFCNDMDQEQAAAFWPGSVRTCGRHRRIPSPTGVTTTSTKCPRRMCSVCGIRACLPHGRKSLQLGSRLTRSCASMPGIKS